MFHDLAMRRGLCVTLEEKSIHLTVLLTIEQIDTNSFFLLLSSVCDTSCHQFLAPISSFMFHSLAVFSLLVLFIFILRQTSPMHYYTLRVCVCVMCCSTYLSRSEEENSMHVVPLMNSVVVSEQREVHRPEGGREKNRCFACRCRRINAQKHFSHDI